MGKPLFNDGTLRAMNWMEFVAALVGHLAWPIALIVLVVVFRQPLVALIGDVSEGEAGPAGVKFKRAWRRTAEAVARSEGTAPADHEPPTSDDLAVAGTRRSNGLAGPRRPSSYESYHAATSPESAITGAHRQVADRLRELLGESTGAPSGDDDIAVLGAQARTACLIPADVLDSVQGLSIMYDLARSAPERVTLAQAQEFQVLAKAVLYTLGDRRLGRTTTLQ